MKVKDLSLIMLSHWTMKHPCELCISIDWYMHMPGKDRLIVPVSFNFKNATDTTMVISLLAGESVEPVV